jgi:hypothetical protein
MRAALTALVIALSAIPTLAATPALAHGATPASFSSFTFGGNYWDGVGRLAPDRSAFSPPFGGTLRHLGFDLDMTYGHRAVEIGSAMLYAGGSIGLQTNSSDQRFAGTDAGTGRPVHADMFANTGYFAVSGDLVWGAASRWPLHVGGGVGAYLLRIKDQIIFGGAGGSFVDDSP